MLEAMAMTAEAPLHVPNHVPNPSTGFLESNGYAHAFDSDRKLQFLQVYKASGLAFYQTCKQMGVSTNTVHHHSKIDPAFQEALEEVRKEYADDLEARSRTVALNKESATLERIFHLRAIFPEKYARDLKDQNSSKIEINVIGDVLVSHKKKSETLDTTIIDDVQYQISPQIPPSPSISHSSSELRNDDSAARP